MGKQHETLKTELYAEQTTPSAGAPTQAVEGGKKQFVEPEISVPVDVLETTTFFQNQTASVVIS